MSVISDATDRIMATILVGSGPSFEAYDFGKGETFVTNYDSNNVSVIDDATDKVVATVPTGPYPEGIAYDARLGELFVANGGNNSVSVISDATNQVVETIPGQYPGSPNAYPGAAYDGGQHEVFVTIPSSNLVSVISDSTDQVVATVNVGSWPLGAVYDAREGEVFVANANSNNVSVISDSTDQVVATIPVGSTPWGIGFDASQGEVFVANWGSNSVSVISDATNSIVATVPVGGTPHEVAYDPGEGELFVTNWDSDNVSVISDGTGGTHFKVTFKESGLPANTPWWVNLTNGQTFHSSKTTLSFKESNGTFQFSIATTDKIYRAAEGTFKVAGASISKKVTFHLVLYHVTFIETGLPSGTFWWVNLTNGQSFGSTASSILFFETNGTYGFTTASTNPGYTGPSGTFTVAGAKVTEKVKFT